MSKSDDDRTRRNTARAVTCCQRGAVNQPKFGQMAISQLRKDPVVDRWVIIANERSKRPHANRTRTESGSRRAMSFLRRHGRGTPHLKFLPIVMHRLGQYARLESQGRT